MGRGAVADNFNTILGSRRGFTNHRTILIASESRASDELRRLMELACQGKFSEPLAVLQACQDKLGEKPASRADVLCMTISTQMVARTKDFLIPVARSLNYSKTDSEFAANGLSSKMGERLEKILLSCPTDHYEEWLDNAWREEFPGILENWLRRDPLSSAMRIFEQKFVEKAFSKAWKTNDDGPKEQASKVAWNHVVEALLTTPRDHFILPVLSNSERMTCQKRVHQVASTSFINVKLAENWAADHGYKKP
jgi:cation transport regulator ChaB